MKNCFESVRTKVVCLAFLGALSLGGTSAAQMDMNVMMYWADASVIRWTVVGEYEKEDMIMTVSTNAYATVKDRVEIVFDYTTAGNGGMVGTPSFTDFSSETGALRNGAEGCRRPTVDGHYERATLEKIEDGLGGMLAMTVRTDFPAGAVAIACTGGDERVAAKSSTRQDELMVPGIMMLAMGPEASNGDMRVAEDKKSIVFTRGGWTYLYTPTKLN